MGEHKLLMPWGRERIIDVVLGAWSRSRVNQIVIVVRAEDRRLLEACRGWDAKVLTPKPDPVDMKASILAAVDWIEGTALPDENDLCFIAPADLPTLSRTLIDGMLSAEGTSPQIRIPFFGGKQGHPVLMPWPMVSAVRDLAEGEGLDSLIARESFLPLEFPAELRPRDVDTPEDYRKLAEDQRGDIGRTGRGGRDARGGGETPD